MPGRKYEQNPKVMVFILIKGHNAAWSPKPWQPIMATEVSALLHSPTKHDSINTDVLGW